MSDHEPYRLADLDDLRVTLDRLGLTLPIEEDLGVLAEPVMLGWHESPNRFAVHPMEGFDATEEGSPTELSFRRYRRYAEGGSGVIWFEATAILSDVRSNPRQLWIARHNVDAYARLVDETRRAAREVHHHDLVLILQLTHSGRYSKPSGVPRPIIAHHSPILDPLHHLPTDYPLIDDASLDRLQDTYVEAARFAAQAGFDGVDIKSCHRYLISELLASHTRDGRYGGSLENRSRLLREVMGRIRHDVPNLFVTTRMNVFDAIAHPFGFGVDRENDQVADLSEPLELIAELQPLGIPLLNVTIGNPYFNPHFGRPFDWPIVGGKTPNEHPLEGVVRFVQITRQVQEAFPELPIVGTGYSWLRHLIPYVASGVIRSGGSSLLGQGRGAFAYPDSPRDILSTGRMDPKKTCVTCSACSQIMRDGAKTGCVVRDAPIYEPQYRLGRRHATDRLRERARACRDCQFASCSSACPAHVDVPGFVLAFADGDVPRSYDILRQSNVLPEMCAQVCPVEVQCEGACIDRIFHERAVPIRDIQLAVSREARRRGLVGVRIPRDTTGRDIAVVGGGPAGVACAICLVEKGHVVTLHEKNGQLGGTPDAIIPAGRYPQATEELHAVLMPARESGRLTVRFDSALGHNLSLDELRERHDAVFLAIGLGRSLSLGSAVGVYDALVFLSLAKQNRLPTVPKCVAVLGGGNTAMDAAATALRAGARDVYLIYRRSFAEMPAWPAERDEVLNAGCHLLILTQPLGYQTDDQGVLTGLKIARTRLGEPDDSGRRRPMLVPDTETQLNVDWVIEAIGQEISPSIRDALTPLEMTEHNLIATKPNSQATSLPDVFAGGDITNGGTTVIEAISNGMLAAHQIDTWLRNPKKGDAAH